MREKIKLVSSAGTGHYYTTDKNKRTMPDKMEVKKYDPVVRKHVIGTCLQKLSDLRSLWAGPEHIGKPEIQESVCDTFHPSVMAHN